MKDKQKSLENLDFITELTISEQESINGGFGFTSHSKPVGSGKPTPTSQGNSSTPDDTWNEEKPQNPFNITI